ncbi:PQQ-binding-like beta-propeller repeat protein [Nannocystis punicea]|uniref:PQQ-binding-like beta-propeller repeat protein n=1 Tax=Nannocystis punicea TaxID=2995304 RepID=A0ABY7H689_9BACT|nr:PQQ-binding-like beta-propeller repeat protein [Nannocystis poenicansa]WAS94786.1 PQQ-binding-like beta-propeller repeat protein [Nannocystis poenicansa]
MAWEKHWLICLGVLSACNPQGGDTATAGESAGSTEPSPGESSTGGSETSTDAPTTSGGSGDELGCADVRWAHDVPKLHTLMDLAVDSRGHVRATESEPGTFRVLDLDPQGVELAPLEVSTPEVSARWGGVDGEGNVLLQVEQSTPQAQRDWVRKYSVDGALLWEVEFDLASDGGVLGRPIPGPDGSTVVTHTSSLVALDSAGSVAWKQPNPDFMQAFARSSAGVTAAVVLTTRKVRALGPDGAQLWEVEWGKEALTERFVGVDAAGGVVIGEQLNGLARFSSDGALEWERTEAEVGVTIGALAMNEAGQIAVLGHPIEPNGPPTAVRLGPDGAEVGRRACAELASELVAIDDSGRITVAGYDFDDGQYDWWVVAFAD